MRKLVAISCLMLLICLLPLGGARMYIVDSEGFAYTTINEAVADAGDEDIIYIKPGTYSEEVVLDKKLYLMPLKGEEGPIVLQGDGMEAGITINADGCSIEGMTIAGFAEAGIKVASAGNLIKNNQLTQSRAGILLFDSSDNEVSGNALTDCTGGIVLYAGSKNNRLLDNQISNSSLSILLRDVPGNAITGNKISSCDYGVYLMNCSNNQIDQNAIKESTFGINLENCTNNTIQGCTIESGGYGLNVLASSGNVFQNNNLTSFEDTAINMIYCRDNEFKDNLVKDSQFGIIVLDSEMNALENNRLEGTDRGLYVEDFTGHGLNNQISETNTIDGEPILYIYGQKGAVIQGREVAHLTLAESQDCTVQGNTITNDALMLANSTGNRIVENNASGCWGMALTNASGNLVANNRAVANKYNGLILVISEGNNISGNILSENSQNGLRLIESRANSISANQVDQNVQAGIWLNVSAKNLISGNQISNNSMGLSITMSVDNRIYHNNFLDNGEQAEDKLGNNTWDGGEVDGGNFWSDLSCRGYICQDFPKLISGGAIDRYPYAERDGWTKPRPLPPSNLSANVSTNASTNESTILAANVSTSISTNVSAGVTPDLSAGPSVNLSSNQSAEASEAYVNLSASDSGSDVGDNPSA